MSNSSIWLINRTLPGATTPGQSEPKNNGNEGVLRNPQRTKTGTSPLNFLVSYPGHLLDGGPNLSAKMQSVYFTCPAEWDILVRLFDAKNKFICKQLHGFK